MRAVDGVLPLLLLLLLGVIRGGAVNLSKWVMELGAVVYNYAFWQSLLAALILLAVGLARRDARIPDMLAHWKFYLCIGLVGLAAPNLLMFQSLYYIPAGLGVVILGLVPLMVFSISLATGAERPDPRRLIGLIIALFGVVLIALPGGGFSQSTPLFWIAACFVAVVGYSVAAVLSQSHRPKGIGAMANASGMMFGSAAWLLPVALATGTFSPPIPFSTAYDPFIVGHGFVAATAFTLFFTIVAMRGAVFYSQSTYVITVSGIIWGIVIFGEQPAGTFWVGTAFVLLGLALVSSSRVKSPDTPPIV
jgi:drug/metabolite transporter (DMT)-like permease